MKGKPECTAKYYPHAGGVTGGQVEATPQADPMPGTMSSAASDDGVHDISDHVAYNASVSRPAPAKEPSNGGGPFMAGDPTAANPATETPYWKKG